jgi:hypothetical protein
MQAEKRNGYCLNPNLWNFRIYRMNVFIQP